MARTSSPDEEAPADERRPTSPTSASASNVQLEKEDNEAGSFEHFQAPLGAVLPFCLRGFPLKATTHKGCLSFSLEHVCACTHFTSVSREAKGNRHYFGSPYVDTCHFLVFRKIGCDPRVWLVSFISQDELAPEGPYFLSLTSNL